MCFICSFIKLLLFLQHPYCTVIETTQFFTQMKNPAAAPIPSSLSLGEPFVSLEYDQIYYCDFLKQYMIIYYCIFLNYIFLC